MANEKPFQGIATFLKTPSDESRPIGVVGIPMDLATSFRPGARLGPNAIRHASMFLTDGAHPVLGVDPAKNVTDMGDVVVSNVDVTKSLNQISVAIASSPFIGKGKRLMVMGGDHLTTLGILRGLAQHPHSPNKPLACVHLDAHCDTWNDHFGDPIGHGTWVRNAIDEGLIDPNRTISIGLRSPVDVETRNWLASKGGRSVTAREARSAGAVKMACWVRDLVREEPCWLTVDIDVLDPAYAPGTGTPEVGGLDPDTVLELIERIAPISFLGMDLVEVSPAYDHSQITSLAAATIMWSFAAGTPCNS